MKKMKPEQCKANQVYYIISWNFKKRVSDRIKILGIASYQSQLNEIKVAEMKNQEG
jgi:hypothetical protein